MLSTGFIRHNKFYYHISMKEEKTKKNSEFYHISEIE